MAFAGRPHLARGHHANPDGGVTYLFHDVTERLDLERRFEELIRFQGETLDNLAEGVAVFSSDGRVRLHNPAFARMWRLSPQALAERPHIETLSTLCQPLHGDSAVWLALREVVTAIDSREAIGGGSSGATAPWSTARPYRCPMAPRW